MEGSGKSVEEHREEVPKDVGMQGRNLERRKTGQDLRRREWGHEPRF